MRNPLRAEVARDVELAADMCASPAGRAAPAPRGDAPAPRGDDSRLRSRRRRRAVAADRTRLVDRASAAAQSRGRLRISHAKSSTSLLARDMFHNVVKTPLRTIVAFVFFSYFSAAFVFALLWWAASSRCDVGVGSFRGAFLFSVETLFTIGYGTRDQFFDGCWEAPLLVFSEGMVGVLLGCVTLGIVYTRGRAEIFRL